MKYCALHKTWLMLLVTFSLCSEKAFSQNNFWEEDVWKSQTRGFLYYGPNDSEKPSKDRELTQISSLEGLQKEAQARLTRAIMKPTKETLASYLEVNAFLLQKSQTFAKTWQQTLWELPQFDETVTFPKANFAQVALKENREKEKQSLLKTLKDRYALLFVVQAECPYCEVMAPISRFVEETYHMKTLPVYLGTTQPSAWPNALPDNGILRELSEKTQTPITQTPAIFIVSQSGEARLIASGALSADELMDRVFMTIKEN